MDREKWMFLDALFQNEKASLDRQIKQKLREEFSEEERRVHDALIQQKWNAENSPAYGSKTSQDKAMTAAEAAYNHGNSLIYAKIEIRKNELTQQVDRELDKIYQFDGGNRRTAEKQHKDWLTEQAKNRTAHDDPNKDSRQMTQEEKSSDKPITIQTEFNDPKPTIKETFNERGIDNDELGDVDLEQ